MNNNDYHVYSEDIKRHYKPITKKEQNVLFPKYRSGDKRAYDKIFLSVSNFVIGIANRYRNQGVDMPDLIQAGNLAIDTSIKRFDERQDVKFYSYAVNWIKQAMLQELAEQSREIKINTGVANKKHQVKKAINYLEQKHCRTPRIEEVAEHTKISESEIKQLNILEVQNLDAPVTENLKLSDIIEDSSFSPDEYDLSSIVTKINNFVDSASIKSEKKAIMKRFFGLNQPNPEDQEQIADTLSITGERVRQIKNEALVNLKNINCAREEREEFCLSANMI
jgi:RNA polymerase primary sigma factor